MSKVVYMFHSIGRLDNGDVADLHYNYASDKFVSLLKDVGPVTSIAESIENNTLDKHIATFDDGHISNYEAAICMIENKLGYGDFFVNPGVVGEKFFMDWQQLRELSDLGMSIQSHSNYHIYLSDLSAEKQKKQLEISKNIIEDKLGKRVSVLAPPGGRYNRKTEELAFQLGYEVIANSKPGVWSNLNEKLIPRIPVMLNDEVNKLAECTEVNSNYVRKLKNKYLITGAAKKLLGNRKYEKYRGIILGEGK